MNECSQVNKLISGFSPIYVWVIEFGITHFRLVLHLHSGDYPNGIRLECLGCVFIHGPMQGGPYKKIQIEKVTDDDFLLKSDDEGFIVKFNQMKLIQMR